MRISTINKNTKTTFGDIRRRLNENTVEVIPTSKKEEEIHFSYFWGAITLATLLGYLVYKK